LPDSDVDRTLGACGLFVFPYRATIAASAAVARAIALGKPFAVSQRLAATLELPGETLVCGDTVDQIQRFLKPSRFGNCTKPERSRSRFGRNVHSLESPIPSRVSIAILPSSSDRPHS
jgi:class 3 adenylate cyclase